MPGLTYMGRDLGSDALKKPSPWRIAPNARLTSHSLASKDTSASSMFILQRQMLESGRSLGESEEKNESHKDRQPRTQGTRQDGGNGSGSEPSSQ